MQSIVDQMVASQEKRLVKVNTMHALSNVHALGKFASKFAHKLSNMQPRAASQAAIRATRPFDEIAEASENAVSMKNLPFGAGFQKQRTTSEGAARVRYQGRLVR
jgi:hypothetical protein